MRNPIRFLRITLLVGVVAWTFLGGAAEAATMSFAVRSVEEGLSQSSVNSIGEDWRGYLWFGTKDGLNRFDGYEFRVFRHDPRDPGSLSDSYVTVLLASRRGRLLWVGTRSGLDVYDPFTGTFRPVELGTGSDQITALLESDDGSLWVGTGASGLIRVEPETGAYESFRSAPEDSATLPHDHVTSLLAGEDGALWVGTFGGGLARLAEGTFRSWRHRPAAPTSLGSDLVQSLHRDGKGRLWVGTADAGLHLVRPDGGFDRFAHDPEDSGSLGHDNVRAILQGKSGTLWVATFGGGLSHFDPRTGRFTVYRRNLRNPLDVASLPHNFLASAFRDRSGTVWLGTDDGGLISFSPKRDRFRHFHNDLANDNSLSHNTVWSFYRDRQGSLWLGTSQGLNRYRPADDRFELFPAPAGDSAAEELQRRVIWSLAGTADAEGGEVLWVGTMAGGLFRVELTTGAVRRFRHDPADPATLASNRVRTLHPDDRGGLWIGSQGSGLSRLELATETVTRHRRSRLELGRPRNAGQDLVTTLWTDTDGTLWVGTQGGGLTRFEPELEEFLDHRHDPRDEISLSSDQVYAVYRDGKGDLWIGTGSGLDRMQSDRRSFRRYGEADGLPSGAVYCILEDDRGDLWLSTANGLSHFRQRTGEFRNFDSLDGLLGTRFDTCACYPGGASGDSQEGLLFGGHSGFVSFQPWEIRDNPYIPPVVLTRFKVFQRSVPFEEALEVGGRIELPHRDNFLSFEFAALDFTNPERNQYRVQLVGHDPDWSEPGGDRQATYSNLSPGDYTFCVQGSNNDGAWNEEGVRLALRIVPPLWRTWWAYSLYGVALFFGLLLLFYLQARRVERQAEDRRKTEELERARSLQLSMLPETPPSLPGLDIAVYMKTATEVGGDYYDFFPQPDGTLYIAVGDATGHGISAGMMVSMTKIALRSLQVRSPERILTRLSEILREIHPSGLRMALGLTHVTAGELRFSSAAMPPALVLRHATGEVEELLKPALPLGGTLPVDYVCSASALDVGDTLVLISDGLPEQLNPEDEFLGYRLIQECLREQRGRPAEQVLDALVGLGRDWARGRPNLDDITVLVVRRTPEGDSTTS